MLFTFNNVSCETHGLKVKTSNHLSSPAKKIESIEIPGRTGNLIVDDGSKKNLTINVVCYLDCRTDDNIAVVSKRIASWLQDTIGYQRLVFSDGLKFDAVCVNQIDIEEVINNFAEVSISFDAKEVLE